MAEKNEYRLFKVAKELNVGTDTLVEHLVAKGQSVDSANPLNAKLNQAQYELLLTHFAPDKVQKAKATQLKEQVKAPATQQESAVEESDSPISIEQLRNEVEGKKKPEVALIQKPKVVGKVDLEALRRKPNTPAVKESPVNTPPVEKAPVVKEQNIVVEKVETPVPPKTEKEEVKAPLEQEVLRAHAPQTAGLKVVDKIDLSQFDKKKGKGKEKFKPKGPNTTPIMSSAKPPVTTSTTTGDAADGEAAKRKRRRKRKKASPVDVTTTPQTASVGAPKDPKKEGTTSTGNNSNSGNNKNKKREKKPEINQKEVKKNVKDALRIMGESSGRTRQNLRRDKRDRAAERREQDAIEEMEQSKILRVTEFVSANEFAEMMDKPVRDVITQCFKLGHMVSINQRLDAELMTIIADEYGYSIEFIDVTEEEFEDVVEDSADDLVHRDPVITVMGHVDHGKTTLLDYLRKANVAGKEAGGITQHIGAYQVKLKDGRRVTFLDTPGHEAFTAMRARGAKVTDVAIIVIAADDAIMPQTKEAIAHAQSAGVAMVFAINKIDKPNADPNRIRTQLAEMNLLVEEWGGKYQSQEIAAKFGVNTDELLEKVMLEAEVLDLKANPDREASGSVIESRVDKGRGNVVTMLVQNGTIRVGDSLVGGIYYGKVKALINQNGERIQEAGPSTPVQVLGMSGLPGAGDKFQAYPEDYKAKEVATKRQELYREQQLRQQKRLTLEEIARRKSLGNFRELNLIIKGDVDGSVEALAGAMLKLSNDEVAVNIILKGTGAISESDILLASASDAVIIAFNVRPTLKAKGLAEQEGVNVRTYSIIFEAINDVKDALEGMLAPEVKEEIMGTVEIREVFKVSKVGLVAGCYVTSGKIYRADPVRIIRNDVVVAETSLASLKRFKDDVKDVAYGYECGMMFDNLQDIQVGDIVESFRRKEVKRQLSR